MSFLLKSTWTNLFYLLQEHLQSWFDDLQVAPELSHNILQGILQNHVLKVEVLSDFHRVCGKNYPRTLCKLLFVRRQFTESAQMEMCLAQMTRSKRMSLFFFEESYRKYNFLTML